MDASRTASPPVTISMPLRLPVEEDAARAVNISVSVPMPLWSCCGGAMALEFVATDLQDVLEKLELRYPKLYRSICDETGAVRRHINLFVNTEHMRDCAGLETTFKSGDIVTIMTAVSGG